MKGIVTALALALAGAACGGDAESPEARIRSVIEQVARAVEARDVGAVKLHVADDFEDFQGRDRRELASFVTFHTLRNQSIHVLVRVRQIVFPEPGRAAVVVTAATAGRPLEKGADLVALRADVYHVELDLEERDGTWLLVFAQWRPASPAELV